MRVAETRRNIINSFSALVMLLFAMSFAGSVNAEMRAEKTEGETSAEILQIKDAYQPERPGFMTMNAGYLKIENLTDKDVHLVGVSSPDYQSVSIHRSFEVDGMQNMESVSSLKVAGGEQLSLEPGGTHLMLEMPFAARKVGDFTTIVFALEGGEKLTFKMPVTTP